MMLCTVYSAHVHAKKLVKSTLGVMIGKGEREFLIENNDAKSRIEQQMILLMEEEKMKKSRYQMKMNENFDLNVTKATTFLVQCDDEMVFFKA